MGANLLVMLGMLAGHAGDVENDADDVDGRVFFVHFARKCFKLRNLVARTENNKSQNRTKTNLKINLDPFFFAAYLTCHAKGDPMPGFAASE